MKHEDAWNEKLMMQDAQFWVQGEDQPWSRCGEPNAAAAAAAAGSSNVSDEFCV